MEAICQAGYGAFEQETLRGLRVEETPDYVVQIYRMHHDAWVGPEAETVYAIQDNLSAHRATAVLLWSLAHPRWESIFQPTYAAYLNLIEPWWKTLRSLALKGRCFATWEEVAQAIAGATAYWNKHRHPFLWGQRRRHRARRKPGLARPAHFALVA
jgi:transposase